jgi:hypothetical protein
MTPAEQELNHALCEWRGWNGIYGDDIKFGFLTQDKEEQSQPIPNHIDDISSLGHVHEAEKGLTGDQQHDYEMHLLRMDYPDWEIKVTHATAKQRTIALLTVVNPAFIKTWKQKYPNNKSTE